MKYTCTLKQPNNNIVIINDLKMKDLIENIKNFIKIHYQFDVNITNQVIYNLMNKNKGRKVSSIMASIILNINKC